MATPARRSVHRKPATSPSKGLVRVLARLKPAQVAALHQEARRRMEQRGQRHLDMSEVVREAVAEWMAIRPAQRAVIRAIARHHELTHAEVLRKALDAWLTALELPDRAARRRRRS